MFKEAKTQSPYFRKISGWVIVIALIVICLLSGFDFYTPPEYVVVTMAAMASLLLGIGNITDIWKKTEAPAEAPVQDPDVG